jgi:hypothetical protein
VWSFLIVVACATLVPVAARADDCARIAVWRDGVRGASVCRAEAAARGLTVLELGDAWVPPVLAAPPGGPAPGYQATYLALAQERFADAGLGDWCETPVDDTSTPSESSAA